MTTFSVPNTFTPLTTISSSQMNANFTAVAAAFGQSLGIDAAETLTGALKASNGAAAAPSLTFGSDIDTGIYRKAADSLGFATGGVERMYIDGSGNFITTGVSKRRNIADVTSGDTIVATDFNKLVNIASGTGTLAFTAAATLAAGFVCKIKNSGTGDVTLNPDSTEQIDGLTSWILYPGGSIEVYCDGSAFYSVLLSPMEVTFNSSSTFTTPGVGTFVEGEIWGAGGSGGRGTTNLAGSGGGGGACLPFKFLRTALGATETVTIGAGGAARTTNVAGANGGNSTFGSLVTGYGGGAGQVTAVNAGGGGGGAISAANGALGGSPAGDDTGLADGFGGAGSEVIFGNSSGYGGAAGGPGDLDTGGDGGDSVWGGAGGGGGGDTIAGGNGGNSIFGGNGGNGATGSANAQNGSQPAGGGGGSETGNSGAGANGRLVVRIF
jgi:hypothetical protein